LLTVSWSTRGINFADFEPDLEGVCVLVSGRLRVEETTQILDGKDYPIVIANFPSEFVHRESKCLLLNDVRLAKIGQEGIQELGTEAIYPEIVKRIIASVSDDQERKSMATPKRDFDVFLSHNSKDKVTVRQLAESLQARGIMVWLDEWELVPGRPWQDALEEVIATTRAAAVLVGGDGFGPWEIREMRGCLSEFVNRRMPVIPVLLPTASRRPELPIFLKQFTWVDLSAGLLTEGLDRLIWGITGQKAKL
jgi:nucleotide-binding universal stress UspA family protein